MAQYYTIIYAIFLISQLGFAVVNAFPETLTVQVKNDLQNIILNWKRTDGYMANNNLPIWRAWRDRAPELIPGLMGEIGPFSMYHDTKKSSAIVLFHKPQRIYGVIDTRFYISALPLNEVGPDIQHIVGEGYIHKRPDRDFHDVLYDFPLITQGDLTYVSTFFRPSSPQDPDVLATDPVLDAQAGPSHEHSVSLTRRYGDTLYAEVLVFISNGVLQYFTKKDPDLKLIIAYYLIHFNSIDMLYAKLADHVKIHINIAGFVLESERIVFPYAFVPGEQPLRTLNGDETLKGFSSYTKKYEDVFVRDSFDFFFVSTYYKIDDEGIDLLGLSRSVNTYNNRRKSRSKYDVSGVIVKLRSIYTDYIDAAHEIAHQLNVEHDPVEAGNTCIGQQCFAILQESGTYCRHCIRWSDQSIRELQIFASFNKNRCFLLNQPRSLHPHGTAVRTIDPSRQCTCYGYQSHHSGTHLDEVPSHRCNVKLACTQDNRPVHYAIPKPFDGTPCGAQKVCWREECQYLPIPPFVQQMK